MMMSNELYDVLNKIQRWLPALGAFYVGLAAIWNLPLADQINQTIAVFCGLLAASLEISTGRYNKLYGGDI